MNAWRTTLVMLALTAPAVAAPPQQWTAAPGARAVDQAVADLDPLSTSMRRMQVGLRLGGEQSSLYRLDQPVAGGDGVSWAPGGIGQVQPVYYRVAPGFVARVDRGDYLIRVGRQDYQRNIAPKVDGRFVELVPANTVYELKPPTPVAPAALPGPDTRIDQRVDRRIDGRIEGRIDARLSPTP